jgi:DNA mismatch repair protein MutS
LFSSQPRVAKAPAKTSAIEAELAEVRPDDLSPKEALELLYKLKGYLKDSG